MAQFAREKGLFVDSFISAGNEAFGLMLQSTWQSRF